VIKFICLGCPEEFTSSRAAADHSRATLHRITISLGPDTRPASTVPYAECACGAVLNSALDVRAHAAQHHDWRIVRTDGVPVVTGEDSETE
jgi:hypothetical protein